MAKRLFLVNQRSFQRGNSTRFESIFRNEIRLGNILDADFTDLFSIFSRKANASLHFIDITQAAGDYLAGLTGVIEIPLSALTSPASVLDGNATVDTIETRLGYGLRADNTVLAKLYQLIGRIEHDAATDGFD